MTIEAEALEQSPYKSNTLNIPSKYTSVGTLVSELQSFPVTQQIRLNASFECLSIGGGIVDRAARDIGRKNNN
jgi:hypothetical protein